MLGGGMRQAGVLAAAGILALTEQVQHLDEDHQNATRLALKLQELSVTGVDPDTVQTNMVFVNVPAGSLKSVIGTMAAEGILVSGSRDTLRLVTHFDFKRDHIDAVAGALSRTLQDL